MKKSTNSISYIASITFVMLVALWTPTAIFAQAAQADPLAAEIVAAGDDLDVIATIISRELSNGNFDGLASSLASAAQSTVDTDVSLAATLVTQAIIIADSAGDDTQSDVGGAASVVATAATNAGDNLAADTVETAITGALDSDMQSAYNNDGGRANPNFVAGAGTPTGDTTTPTGDTSTPTGDTTTPTGDTSTGGQFVSTNANGDPVALPVNRNEQMTTNPDGTTGTVLPDHLAPSVGGGPPPPPPTGGIINLPVPLEPPQSTGGSAV